MASEIKTENNTNSSSNGSTNLGKPLKRSNKPAMERRRRERINNSLEVLKKLVLESLKKDTSQYSKLEKADILEMTVKHLRGMQRQQLQLAAATDNTVVSKYRAGFTECAQEVTRYLGQVDGLHPDTRGRLFQHLQNCMQQSPVPESHQSQVAHHMNSTATTTSQPLSVSIPAGTPVTSLPGTPAVGSPQAQLMQQIPVISAISSQGMPHFLGAFQMVPGAMVGSEVALLLPTSAASVMSTTSSHSNQSVASVSPSVSPSSSRGSPGSIHSGSSPRSTISPPNLHSTFYSSTALDLQVRRTSTSPSTQATYQPHHIRQQQQHSYSNNSTVPAYHQMAPVALNTKQVAPMHNIVPVNVALKEEKVWRPW